VPSCCVPWSWSSRNVSRPSWRGEQLQTNCESSPLLSGIIICSDEGEQQLPPAFPDDVTGNRWPHQRP
jgi:hypothetical protein